MNRGRVTQLVLLLSVILVGATLWAGWDALKLFGGMAPKGLPRTAFANTAPGAAAQLVIQVLSIGKDGEITGRLLEGREERYRSTSVPVVGQLTAHAAVLMGTAADIKPHAVLDISGKLDAHHRISVERVIVLTGYVTVER